MDLIKTINYFFIDIKCDSENRIISTEIKSQILLQEKEEIIQVYKFTKNISSNIQINTGILLELQQKKIQQGSHKFKQQKIHRKMISKLIYEAQLTKDDRKRFIPFVNERDHMGSIIKQKHRDKQHYKSMEVFQNLKKTTKQYFFDKKYQKMKQKLQRCKHSMIQKEPNYDAQIKSCLRAIQKIQNSRIKDLNITNLEDSNIFFVDLNQKLNSNISTLKQQIQNNKKSRTLVKQKSFHSSLGKSKTVNYPSKSLSQLNFKPQFSNKNWQNEEIRRKTFNNSKQKDYLNDKIAKNQINRQLFRQISPQSQTMADFTNFGLKYKQYVKADKKDPWKKWYVNSKIQIFPGQTIKIKRLQKSIYD